jgi:hypothetical protein
MLLFYRQLFLYEHNLKIAFLCGCMKSRFFYIIRFRSYMYIVSHELMSGHLGLRTFSSNKPTNITDSKKNCLGEVMPPTDTKYYCISESQSLVTNHRKLSSPTPINLPAHNFVTKLLC